MKNLTIKKVALGLVLAGYAASGAFAALSTTTNQTIQGRSPVVAKTGLTITAGTDANTAVTAANRYLEIDLQDSSGTSRGNVAPNSGDKFVFTFATYDGDGDTDSDLAKGTTKNFVFYYKKGGTWSNVTVTPTATGTVTIPITAAMAGATDFGYTITAETKYGVSEDPNAAGTYNQKGNIITVSDMNNTGPTCSTGLPPTAPGCGTGGEGPFPGPIGGGTFKGALFIDGGSTATLADNYSQGSKYPIQGQKFNLVVWDDTNGNNIIDGTEAAIAVGTTSGLVDSTTIKWYLMGDDTAAGATAPGHQAAASGTEITANAGNTNYTIPATNTAIVTGAVAGHQGYTLKVEFDFIP